MSRVAQLLLAWGAVFLINLVPAFMPPTWSMLAFFLIHFDLPLLPLALGGAVAATGGRVALALGTRYLGPRLLPADVRRNLTDLGTWLSTRRRWVGLGVLFYSFGPIPSNQLFMAAGLGGLDLRVVAGSFFVGRVISYTFFSYTANKAVESLSDLFAGTFTHTTTLLLEVASLGILVALAKLPWGRLLHVPQAGASDGTPTPP